MANTTSGTATFDKTFAIDEIVEESFERIGLQNVAGYQLKSASNEAWYATASDHISIELPVGK